MNYITKTTKLYKRRLRQSHTIGNNHQHIDYSTNDHIRAHSKISYTALQMFTGGLQGTHRFSLQYLWNRAVRIAQKPYTPQKERLCMLWGNPVIFTDCG